jgi:hypothetical protein
MRGNRTRKPSVVDRPTEGRETSRSRRSRATVDATIAAIPIVREAMAFVPWDSRRLPPDAIALLGEPSIAVACHRTWGLDLLHYLIAILPIFTRQSWRDRRENAFNRSAHSTPAIGAVP